MRWDAMGCDAMDGRTYDKWKKRKLDIGLVAAQEMDDGRWTMDGGRWTMGRWDDGTTVLMYCGQY